MTKKLTRRQLAQIKASHDALGAYLEGAEPPFNVASLSRSYGIPEPDVEIILRRHGHVQRA